MRLPEAKIKEAILHPEKLVRQEALHYFTECFSRDTEVMPVAIKAIETFGRRNAFFYVYVLEYLAQTEATVEWVIRELHREEDKAEDHDGYFPALSRLLCSADPQLIVPRATEIIHAPGFNQPLIPGFQERLDLFTWGADRCWKELEDICAGGVSNSDSSDVDFVHASLVVGVLAHQAENYVDRILDLLGKKVEDFENDPMTWLEIFMVMLAGEMRLTQAIPLIVKKLHECGEILSEQCVDALGKIGTDASAEAITEGWLESIWDYRLFATSALEKIHSDTTVKKCLELMPQDKELDIRTKLAEALLVQFDEVAIEPVREMVRKRAYDDFDFNLKERLVAVSTILGVTFPEYLIWKKNVEEKRANSERKMKEMWNVHPAPALARAPKPALPKEPDEILEGKRTPFLRTEKQVGRNDPCPCGSGKKFKKCCMKR